MGKNKFHEPLARIIAEECMEHNVPSLNVETEAQRKARLQAQIEKAFLEVDRSWDLGLECFRQRAEPALISRVIEPLASQAPSSIQSASEFPNDIDFGDLLSLALQSFLKTELDAAEPMLTLLTCLRPEDARAYVGLVSCLWQREGVHEAAQAYEAMMPLLSSSPYLAYHAANCLYEAGKAAKAESYLFEAQKNLVPKLDSDPEAQKLNESITALIESKTT